MDLQGSAGQASEQASMQLGASSPAAGPTLGPSTQQAAAGRGGQGDAPPCRPAGRSPAAASGPAARRQLQRAQLLPFTGAAAAHTTLHEVPSSDSIMQFTHSIIPMSKKHGQTCTRLTEAATLKLYWLGQCCGCFLRICCHHGHRV